MTRQHEQGREFFVIDSGTAQVWRDDRPLGSLSAGDHFGEISLLAGRPRTATVVAETEMDLLVASRREFLALLEADSRSAQAVTRTALARMAVLAS